MSELSDLDQRVLWHPFTQQAEWTPLVIARAEGSFVVDEEGRRYLDGVSSLWCNVHGHRHPVLDRALADQAAQLAHSTFLGLTHEPGIRLAAALVAVVPEGLTRVFYSDSGSTAVEIALKQSFQYWQIRGRGTKQKFLRLGEAYHGDTLGAVGVGGIDLFHRVFGPLLVQSIAIPTPAGTDGRDSLAKLERELSSRAYEIAACVVEPLVQGAAGMLVHPRGFLSSVAELCRVHGVHLIVDEVATGFGRTGTLFACEQESVSPDFLCLAKGIAAGYLPLAATLSTEEIYTAFLGKRSDLKHFFHGHTFTANPLACAVGIASLDLLQRETLPNAQARIPELTAALGGIAKLPGVREVRQVGMMAGIELAPIDGRALGAEVCDRIRAHGVILRNLGDVVVWMPPLSISADELALLERATAAAIAETLPVKGFFVTGTDTGVGKTFVTCALARKARAAGLRVFAFKPIETGVVGEWGEDQLALADASGSLPRGTFVLRMPAAPYVAARAEGIEIDMDRIAAKVRAGAESVDLVLVEGAGGWRVPITDSADMGELARLTKLPVLIVARALLGTINHTLMTIDAVRGDGLEIGGVVLSLRPGEDEAFARSNAEQIEEWSGIAPRIYPDISDLITDS